MTADLFLVHGGLWDAMDAQRFWRTPGIVAGLESTGLEVLAPDRPRMPSGWNHEAEQLGALLPPEPVTLVGSLLRADTLRGVKDGELVRLGIPVAVLPSSFAKDAG